MKVFTRPTGRHSLAMVRVANALEKFAPDWAEIVPTAADADVVVSHVVEAYERPVQREIIIQYCLHGTGFDHAQWQQRWANALVVWSYYDLPYITHQNGFPFYYAPLGVDELFTVPFDDAPRDLDVMTSGYVSSPEAEAIEEVAVAAWMLGLQHVHLGPRKIEGMKVEIDLRILHGLKDSKLASYYRRCKWVSGLRHIEGFELPALEGLCCGARPIVFDRPDMHWYDGHAVFVPECSGSELVKALLDVLGDDPEPVTPDEREWAVERFNWEPIIHDLWARVRRAS